MTKKVEKGEILPIIGRLRAARVPIRKIAQHIGLSIAQTNYYIALFGVPRGTQQKCPHCGLEATDEVRHPL